MQQDLEQIQSFIDKNEDLLLISYGKVIVPLEKNTVRFITVENEEFDIHKVLQQQPYQNIIVLKEKSQPDVNKVVLNLFSNKVTQSYKKNILQINFEDIYDLMNKLQLMFKYIEKTNKKIKWKNMSKISQYLIPQEDVVEHKIQSQKQKEPFKIKLQKNKKFENLQNFVDKYSQIEMIQLIMKNFKNNNNCNDNPKNYIVQKAEQNSNSVTLSMICNKRKKCENPNNHTQKQTFKKIFVIRKLGKLLAILLLLSIQITSIIGFNLKI